MPGFEQVHLTCGSCHMASSTRANKIIIEKISMKDSSWKLRLRASEMIMCSVSNKCLQQTIDDCTL